MKRIVVAFVVVALVLLLGIAAPVSADDPTPYMAGEVLVKTGNGSLLGWELRQVPPGQEKAEVVRQRALGFQAEVNGLWSVLETIPDDPRWAQQYGPNRINAPAAWDLQTGNPALIISVIDTGVDCAHEDQGKCVEGYDFVNNDTDPFDDHGHGTHVAGIAAASTNNGIGVAGVCWMCRIQPVKVLSSGGSGTWEQVASGIVWATDHGAHVINMSLGGYGGSQVAKDAVDYAYANGVILFAAAGNTGTEGVLYPAAYASVIAVAATDSRDSRAGFSTFGPEVELSAPGVGNLSTVPLGPCTLCDPSGYRELSGTSMATPHAAGSAAVVISHLFPDLVFHPLQVRQLLEQTAKDLGDPGWDKFYGYGLVDLFSAITTEPPPEPTPGPTPTATPTPTNTPIPSFALCGKYTGGLTLSAPGIHYFLTCHVNVKGGLMAVNVVIELRGFQLTANGSFFQNVTMIP